MKRSFVIARLVQRRQGHGVSPGLPADYRSFALREIARCCMPRGTARVPAKTATLDGKKQRRAPPAARARGTDVLIADTAGRLLTQLHLMEEIRKVKRVAGKALDGAPRITPVHSAANFSYQTEPAVGDRFIVAGFGVAVQGDRKTAGKLRAVTLVATDRPSSQQLSLVDPQKLGETAGLGVCNGDSGGPVFDARDHALIGIVSWTGRADGEPACGFVSGVIPLARYRYWILETAARLGSPLEP